MVLDLAPGTIVEPGTGRRWEPDEVMRQVAARARRYRRQGIKAGDRVSIHFGNRLEFFAELLAVWRLGGCVIPVDGRLTTFEVVFYCFLLATGIYVSMLREQGRRGRASDARGQVARRLLRIGGVWTFYGVIHIWNGGLATFGQRAHFFLSLLALGDHVP